MKNTISKKYIVDYIVKNYGPMRHDASRMVKAIRLTGGYYGISKVDLFHYIIERSGTVPFTTSYGFDTEYGRRVRNNFKNNYDEI
jgi:hypothetical protein